MTDSGPNREEDQGLSPSPQTQADQGPSQEPTRLSPHEAMLRSVTVMLQNYLYNEETIGGRDETDIIRVSLSIREIKTLLKELT